MEKNIKPILAFIFICCFILTNNAQTTIYTESFETDEFNTNYVMNRFTDGGQDYFGVVDANGNTQFVGANAVNPFALPMTNLDGTKCVAAEDLKRTDNPLNTVTDEYRGYLITKTLDVSAYGQVEVRLLIGCRNAGSFGTHEAADNDAFRIQYAFDTDIATGANNTSPGLTNESTVNTGTYTDIGRFLPNDQFGNGTGKMQEDTNLNGFPNGAILNNTLTEYVYTIPVTGTNLSVRIHMDYDDSAEEMAFDNLRLIASGTPPVSCTDPTIPTATNPTTTGATLSLTENGTATNYDWYIVPTSDPAPTGASTPTINDTTNPTTWSGGTDGVTYDAYVRADCNADNTDVSAWVGPVSFTTLTQVICPANNTLFETIYTTTGWTNGFPTINKCVVMDSNFSTNSFSSYNITVNAGKLFIIAANTFIQVQKEIINNGLIIVMATGSVVQIDDTAMVTGTGTFITNIETIPLQDTDRFTYFGSPITAGDVSVFSDFSAANWDFDASIQNWTYLGDDTATNGMTVGKAYAVRGGNGFSELITFFGEYNNGVVTHPIFFDVYNNMLVNFVNPDATTDDSNFFGNPYPSAIDAVALLTLNPQANALYFWTHDSALPTNGDNFSTDDYAVRTLSGGTNSSSGTTAPTHIATGQGFFIEANASGAFTFNNSVRTTGNNDQFRNPETENDKIWLNLSSLDGQYANQILIAFLENATLDNDAQYDALRLGNNYALSYYSLGNQEERYAIQARPLLTNEDIVPLGLYTNETSITNLSIAIDHLELLDNVTIYLRDNLLNVMHDLNKNAYNFSIASPTELNNRFELIFNRNPLSIDDLSLNNTLIVSNQDANILVSTNNGNTLSNIKIYDVLGKLIINAKANSESVLLPTNINQGTILFIKATLDNGVVLNKKFIKM